MIIDKKLISEVTKKASSTAIYAEICPDGSIHHVENTACHATLMRGGTTKSSVAVINKRCYPSRASKSGELFYDWLINKSPMAPAFVTKDAKIANTSHQIVDLDNPRNMIGCALVASRAPWEQSSTIDFFGDLVEGGVDPTLAFCFASYHTLEHTGEVLAKGETFGSHWLFFGNSRNCNKLLDKDCWEELFLGNDNFLDSRGWSGAPSSFYSPKVLLLPELGQGKFKKYYNLAEKEACGGAQKSPNLNVFEIRPLAKKSKSISIAACVKFLKDNPL